LDIYPKKYWHVFTNKKKNRVKDQGQFLVRLGEMLQRGFILIEAFEFLLLHIEHTDSSVMEEVRHTLEKGGAIVDVLRKLGFPEHTCAQIYFAEHHGSVSTTLIDGGVAISKSKKDRQAMIKVLQYPFMLLFLLAGIMSVMQKVLLPKFEVLYQSLGYKPSGTIAFLLSLFKNFPIILLSLFIVILLSAWLLRKSWKRLSPLKKALILSKIPIISYYAKGFYTQFFTRELGFLLKSGISIHEALNMFEEQKYRVLYQDMAIKMKNQLKLGFSFPKVCDCFPLFRSDLSYILSHGERNGKLDEELLVYSQYCLNEMEEKSSKWMTFIQPIIFIVVGLFIVIVYFSIMIPMFQMMDSI
jgi:competence protein ComGB